MKHEAHTLVPNNPILSELKSAKNQDVQSIAQGSGEFLAPNGMQCEDFNNQSQAAVPLMSDLTQIRESFPSQQLSENHLGPNESQI